MARPRDVVVRFLAETRDFLRGSQGVEDAYRDMAREADRTADAGEDAARDTARAWDRAADSMKRDMRDAGRVTQQSAAEAGQEVGNEFAQNVGESISSGDIEGLLSGTVGGLAGTFGAAGPIGLALAGLGAAAVGVFGAMSRAAEQAAADANTAFQELTEGTSFQARLNNQLETRFGGIVEGWEKITKYSEASGISTSAITRAIANGGREARSLEKIIDRRLRKEYETEGALGAQSALLVDLADDLNDRADATERAAKAAKEENQSLRDTEQVLRRSASYYSARRSGYAVGGSLYQSQVPTGRRVP